MATQAGRTFDEDFPGGGYVFDDQGRTVAETADWSEGVLVTDIHAQERDIRDALVRCLICGHAMMSIHCKLLCLNCGYTIDCSD